MRWFAVVGWVVICLGMADAGRAQDSAGSSEPLVLEADELTHDLDRGIVVATGNVEIAQGRRVILADTVTYNENTDTVTATGNVVMLEPGGEVIFADYAEVTENMKRGVIRNIRILLTDMSRIAANGAVRSGGNRTEMRKAVFSPCPVCEEHPDESPLWQIKAVRVVHDQQRQEIQYSDAFFELFGVPIAYTPYFAHPDPTVKRQSGFLAPTIGNLTQLGLTLQTPYYMNLAPNYDATFAPIFTSEEGVVLTGEYRHRVESGQYSLGGSITRPRQRGANGEVISGRNIRGHVSGTGRFDIDPTWRWGFDMERSTDDTYLRRYGFNSDDTLTSNLFLKGFRGRNYAAVDAYSFQGLERDDDPGDTPFIAPIAEISFISDAGRRGDRFLLDANFMELYRTDGTASTRLSLDGGWRLPYMGPLGDLYALTASLRGDAYWVNHVVDPDNPNNSRSSGMTGRIVPQLALDWRYPLVRSVGSVRQLVEPIVKFALSPHGGNPKKIPNEDSHDFEFDDTNLFNSNRFPGLDRVEGGPRVSYGLRLGAFGSGGGRTTAFFGQSYRARADSTFEAGSGLEGNRSDLVGRITVAPSNYLDLTYRFRLDDDSLASRRSAIDLIAGPEWLRINFGFLSIDEGAADLGVIGRREEIHMSGELALAPQWALNAFNRRDLNGNNTIDFGASLTYQDECILFSTQFKRSFTRDRDVDPDTSINFIIKLKHLG
ncbi:MAG: LPS-assembly protein LptD [Pseudomonadota bacterium]|nr:LPS-assembly protein LptD [Pseudomonadota bacterium]